MVEKAKAILIREYFPMGGRNVYYGRQLEIAIEAKFFHWITKKALNELAAEGKIKFTVEYSKHYRAHCYYQLRHRYPRRRINDALGLISEFSHPMFTEALGQHGELDAGFASVGFRSWIEMYVRSVENVGEKAITTWTV